MDDNKEIVDLDQLSIQMKDEERIKEYCNYVIFEGCSKSEAFRRTFSIAELDSVLSMRMYRWVKSKPVSAWMSKANKSLEVDWIDKRVNALQHLYNIGMDSDNSIREQTNALDVFLTKLDKEQNKILLDMGQPQVNIVQVVQDKLDAITNGATITPNGSIEKKPKGMQRYDGYNEEVAKIIDMRREENES